MRSTCWITASVAVMLTTIPMSAADQSYEWLLPNESLKRSFAETTPIVFVSRGQNAAEWNALKQFWNEVTEEATDPRSGQKVTRKVVKIKLPLGINVPPPVPTENPMTLARWELGKKLYFDPVLSSDLTVSCASCHAPETGYSDASKTSTGIKGQKGGMNAPTVVNSAWNRFQFWDGRAGSLELQSQGPPQNPVEMFDGKGHAWEEVVKRVRAKSDYAGLFEKEFGHAATRDAIAKAIATYERSVIVGNSIYDRAEMAMRKRVAEEESTDRTIKAADFAAVLKDAMANKDTHSLSALGLDAAKDMDKIATVAGQLERGRTLFFGKARCSNCHVGESFTDHDFHNLGVGVVDGKIPAGQEGRYASQPTGHKDPNLMGAFKTPPLRNLVASKPYLHDGSEATLEAVVEFYDRGGNANPFLDQKMRDLEAEAAYMKAKAANQPWTGEPVKVFTPDGRPIIPMKLKLTADEKKDLVKFMQALESDPVDPKVAEVKK